VARAGEDVGLRELLARERDPEVAASMRAALAGATDQLAFRALDT
jgi:hypothetical protein